MKTRNSHGLLQLGRKALAYCQCASALISGNKALFVSVYLIGEKNQVILEYKIFNRTTNLIIHFQVFVTSGLGGMSGAQPKAATICGCIGVIAEVSYIMQMNWVDY